MLLDFSWHVHIDGRFVSQTAPVLVKSCHKYQLLNINLYVSMVITDHPWPRAAAGLYGPRRSARASITSGKRSHYENSSRLRWLPPVQTLPGLPEGGGAAVGAEHGTVAAGVRGTVWVRQGWEGLSTMKTTWLIITLLGWLCKRLWLHQFGDLQLQVLHIMSFWRYLSALHHLVNKTAARTNWSHTWWSKIIQSTSLMWSSLQRI